MKIWAYNLHTCNKLINGLNEIRDEEGLPPHAYHKEEMPSRIKADTKDRETLREKLELIIDPTRSRAASRRSHQRGYGKVCLQFISEHQQCHHGGEKQMETFEQRWPEGFHDTIPRKVVTMSV